MISLIRYSATFFAAVLCFIGNVQASDYPSRPITLIVPFSAGGVTDVIARAVGRSIAAQLKQPVVIDNKPGVAGAMGVVELKNSKPDGYKLALTPISIFRQPYIQKTNYHPIDDVTYIATYMTYDFIIAVNASSPYKSLSDLINQAKTQPGNFSYGTPGKYAAHHITMAMLSKKAGIDFNHIPFKGDTEAINALLAGHIDSIVASNTIVPYLNSGKIRALATAANQRTGDFKSIPTLHDEGYGFDMPSPVGIAGPKNLPADIVSKLDVAIRNAQQDPEFKKVLANYSVRSHYFGPKEYREFAISSFRNEARLLKELNLEVLQ